MHPADLPAHWYVRHCFIGVALTVILGGVIFAILYSLIFVTQPLGDSSENDRKFFELLTPIASFIVGALGGVMAAGNNRNKGGSDETPPTQEYTE